MKGSASDHRAVRAVMKRAVRRLGVLEALVLAAAAAASLVGGALAAFLAQSAFGLPFRPAWAAASLLLFVVPGLAALARNARSAAGKASSGGGATAPETEGGRWRSGKG